MTSIDDKIKIVLKSRRDQRQYPRGGGGGGRPRGAHRFSNRPEHVTGHAAAERMRNVYAFQISRYQSGTLHKFVATPYS